MVSFLMTRSEIGGTFRSLILPPTFASAGLVAGFLLKKGPWPEITKLQLSLVTLAVTSAAVLLLFPRIFAIPFGRIGPKEYLANLGLYRPQPLGKLVLLGAVASTFTLSGMLIGSLLTGKYSFSADTITVGQAVFSLTPGVWEEILFRGVLMIVLLRLTKSYRRAALIQIGAFGVAHIKGADALALVDSFSVLVLAAAFTYIAYKTKSLVPGIVFHALHDTFLFAVQLPSGEYVGLRDNFFFYASLWIMIGLCIVVIKLFVERFVVVSPIDFYAVHSGVPPQSSRASHPLRSDLTRGSAVS